VEVEQFITSLASAIEKRGDDVCIIAGVDLSHLGKRFGQDISINDEFLEWMEKEDRRMLTPVLEADADAFFSSIRSEEDKRNVCGVPAIYTLLKLLESHTVKSELLCYDMAVDDATQSVVSFAGISFFG
jgi:AmmeMemoRadiSam system protein B